MRYIERMNRVQSHTLFTDFDIDLFKLGKHYRLYEKLGSHLVKYKGKKGCYFAVFAPAAKSVRVVGDFNYWAGDEHELYPRWDESGIWEGFIPGLKQGEKYKYKIIPEHGDYVLEKADPFALYAEIPPKTASIIWDLKYDWKDKNWLKSRHKLNAHEAPFSIYEVHLASWKWNEEENRPLSYLELAEELVRYVKEMNYTHVELMPVMEHPYPPSWGYQITGFFAPTSRFGTPEDFMHLVDRLHQENIGVILDWVPAHFPSDGHGLGNFDGTHVYEHPDRRKGFHPDWNSLIFNYERAEIKSFLISNALFWIHFYHADGLRVDAVASMIYLDYSRDEGDWAPNEYGGRENLAAIAFLKELNEAIYLAFPDIQMIAEESTAFPMVSSPVSHGGLGFGMKWMMGWMNDTLTYFKRESIFRKYHHFEMSFSIVYAFAENFVLPLSHDEVVHGKGSMIRKMPGDIWQRFANLRLLYTYMYTHPGAKLNFMGNEFAQWNEWNHSTCLDWELLEQEDHKGMQLAVRDLNKLYRQLPELYKSQFSNEGFEWIDFTDQKNSIISYMRNYKDQSVIILLNFTPKVHENYIIGVPEKGMYEELFNSDSEIYGGSNVGNLNLIKAKKVKKHGREYSLELHVPPLGGLIMKKKKIARKGKKRKSG